VRSRKAADLVVVPDLDRELDGLYGLPLEQFTAARNELAKRLKRAGQEAESARVAALKKPSISAWAVNELARREKDAVHELLAAGAELLDAQKRALAGEGTDLFDRASRRQRDAIRALVAAAVSLLQDAGHRPSDAVRERIAGSLRSASVDPEARPLLERGRMAEDVQSAGLGLLAGIAPAAPARAKTRRAEPRPSAAELRNARKAVERARKEDERARERAGAAEEQARRAEAAANEAAARAASLAAEASSAAAALAEAERALEQLQSSARRA
jgi:hypothetical protein